jgi:hypothetical protein
MARRMASPVLDSRKKINSFVSSELKRSLSMRGAAKSTREFIFEHGRKGGSNNRDLYGVDFYHWIASKRKIGRGWPVRRQLFFLIAMGNFDCRRSLAKRKLAKATGFREMALNTTEKLGLRAETKKLRHAEI